MKNLLKFSALALAATLTMTSCNDDDDDNPTPAPAPQTIADIAVNDARFTTLVDLLQRTDLVGTLSDANAQYTVFAPTNDAFNDALQALGYANADELEAGLTTDGLRNVLLYHVLGAEVMSKDVTTGFVDMLGTHESGANLDAYISTANGVMLNNVASVSQADVDASNGVIHVIDAVILPLDVVGLASLSPDHTSLVSTLAGTDSDGDGTPGELVSVLSDASATYTVFGPVNAAFDSISSTIATLTDEQIGKVLTYHVVAGANVVAADVAAGPVGTVAMEDITLGTTGGVTITDATGGVSNVVATDIQGTNGVIHVIDRVLIPTL